MAFDGEEFMRRFMKVWNDHDVDGIMAQMTEDVVFEPSFGEAPWGARYVGAKEVRAGIEKNMRNIPDHRWDELRHFVCPEDAVVEWVSTGTPVGGTRFEIHGVDILTLRNGKIAAKRSYRKARL